MSIASSQRSPELAKRLAKLKDAKNVIEESELEPFSKIQEVPPYLKDRKPIAKYYLPKLISFGPIHYHMQLGEQYKLMWASTYIEDKIQNAEELLNEIEIHIEQLKGLFSIDVIERYVDTELAWMLFVDGCSVLQILSHGRSNIYNCLEKLRLKIELCDLLIMDLLLLENQLPYEVLSLLAKEDPRKLADEFLRSNLQFLSVREQEQKSSKLHVLVSISEDSKPSPNHLLDHLRTILLVRKDMFDSQPKNPGKYRNIVEFKKAGIKVKINEEANCLTDIKFVPNLKYEYGELFLPKVVVTEISACALLNLIAHEMCLNSKNNFGAISYLTFLKSLIYNVDDVKELVEAGVLLNALGSDEELLHLFETAGMCAELEPVFSSMAKYLRVRFQMEKYC